MSFSYTSKYLPAIEGLAAVTCVASAGTFLTALYQGRQYTVLAGVCLYTSYNLYQVLKNLRKSTDYSLCTWNTCLCKNTVGFEWAVCMIADQLFGYTALQVHQEIDKSITETITKLFPNSL